MTQFRVLVEKALQAKTEAEFNGLKEDIAKSWARGMLTWEEYELIFQLIDKLNRR